MCVAASSRFAATWGGRKWCDFSGNTQVGRCFCERSTFLSLVSSSNVREGRGGEPAPPPSPSSCRPSHEEALLLEVRCPAGETEPRWHRRQRRTRLRFPSPRTGGGSSYSRAPTVPPPPHQHCKYNHVTEETGVTETSWSRSENQSARFKMTCFQKLLLDLHRRLCWLQRQRISLLLGVQKGEGGAPTAEVDSHLSRSGRDGRDPACFWDSRKAISPPNSPFNSC